MALSATPLPRSPAGQQDAATTDAARQQVHRAGTLLALTRAARQADSMAVLAHVAANETLRLVTYRQAVVWRWGATGRLRIQAVSGVDRPDPHSPYVRYLERLFHHLHRVSDAGDLRSVEAADVPAALAAEWRRHGAGHLLWCPLRTPRGRWLGGVVFMRDTPWPPPTREVMADLTEAYAHAWHALTPLRGGLRRAGSHTWGRRGLCAVLLLALAVLLALPVRMSALAPMAIAPRAPTIVSAPMDGVVAGFAVAPNEKVHSGQPLLHLDDTSLRSRLAVARKSLAIVRADYRRATQKAFGDDRSRGERLLLKARLEEKAAEVDYVEAMLARCRVAAPRDGIAVFADPNDWIGRPVVVGEKILTVADPSQVEADIRLPVSDAIALAPGAPVRLFLDVQPHRPLDAVLRSASYEAEPTHDGVLAFRLKADPEFDGPPPRIGLRGTAKVYGREVPLGYYLFRRPLAAARRHLGV